MKKIISLTVLVCIGIVAHSQEPNKSNSEKVIINHAMIEKFNNAEFNGQGFDITTIFSEYSFDDVKTILQAYKSNKIELTAEDVENLLANKNRQSIDDEQLTTQKKPDARLMASKQK